MLQYCIHKKTPALECLFKEDGGRMKACNFIKKSSNTGVFLSILRKF